MSDGIIKLVGDKEREFTVIQEVGKCVRIEFVHKNVFGEQTMRDVYLKDSPLLTFFKKNAPW